jgi:hypothetical protein
MAVRLNGSCVIEMAVERVHSSLRLILREMDGIKKLHQDLE